MALTLPLQRSSQRELDIQHGVGSLAAGNLSIALDVKLTRRCLIEQTSRHEIGVKKLLELFRTGSAGYRVSGSIVRNRLYVCM